MEIRKPGAAELKPALALAWDVFLKDAATTGLTAKLEGGILTVNVPKQDEKANVTKIAID